MFYAAKSIYFQPISSGFLPLLTKASISNANIYRNQTMRAATVQLSCSFRHPCNTSSFPAGNYIFPVVIIIHQHVADSISNTSHFHLQPAGSLQIHLHPNPQCLEQRSKGQTSFN